MPELTSACLAVSVLLQLSLVLPQAAAELRLPRLAQRCSLDVDGGEATAATLEK